MHQMVLKFEKEAKSDSISLEKECNFFFVEFHPR